MLGPYTLDDGKTPFKSPMTERLADAVAIAWGFGAEYALDLSGGGVLSSEDMEICEGSSAYLSPEILKIHEMLIAQN